MTQSRTPLAVILAAAAVFALWVPTLTPGAINLSRPAPTAVLVAPLA